MLSAAPKAPPGIPLPREVAAIWGAFLYEGLLAHVPDHQRIRAILDAWGQGCIELVIATTLHLPEVWEQISRKWEAEDTDFPGVFEYEVISPLGEYFAEYLLTHDGRLPSKEAVAAEITRLIDVFFAEKPLVVIPMSKAS
ncbi:MAG: hypothetical protein K0Q68_3048 [Moraxellaceae bacterium]|jgi:hypothetical protein|nr:hypothetical protein [Moraxellaceae bacterium]